MAERWGAAPGDWLHFDLALGLTEDLLPVVSNPDAPISAQSKMKSLGKTPSVYNRRRDVAGFKNWTEHKATVDDIALWEKEADYGICLQTRHVRGLDIDISDPERASDIVKYIENIIRVLPRRSRSTSGKCLLAFKLQGDLSKRVIRTDNGIIEFLANGQQFVACGTHPSGSRYTWDWNGHSDFPEITLEQFEALWAALVQEFAITSSGGGVIRNRADTPALNITDPILDKLDVLGWGKEGEAFIECPFKADHSMDSGITQTVYFPAGSRGYEQGHFHCLHAHCAEKEDADFLDALNLRAGQFEDLSKETPSEKKVFNIKMKLGKLHETVEEAEEALIASGLPYYQRGVSLVRPVRKSVHASGGGKTEVVRLFDIDMPYLKRDLCRVATWRRFTRGSMVKVDAPAEVALTMLSDYGNWRFPEVSGVINTPTLRPDGSLLSSPGFDKETGLLLIGIPLMPEVRERPDREDATHALTALKNLLVEFPFANDAARSVALSALITPVVRGAFPVAPMHVVSAPAPGSGKSFLLDIASAIATGQRCPVMAAGRNEEETEKRLGAALMAGQPIISIDNMNGDLGGEFLCQLVERPIVEVRPLGKSQIVQIASRSTLFANGNNIRLLDDMTRRAVLCMMDAKEERPELRRFKHDPVKEVLTGRGRYVAHALTIVRAYLVAGSPDKAPNLASFKEWSDIVRSSLMWLGEEDPVRSMELARAEDPVMQGMTTIFTSISECVGLETPKSAADILRIAEQYDGLGNGGTVGRFENLYEELLNAVGTTAGRLSSKQFGRRLSSYKGRIAGGLRLDGKVDKHNHTAIWWVSEVNLA